jgi:ABC-2 type transport system permease protein
MTRFVSVALAITWRMLKKYATTPNLLVPSLVFPLFFFVAFAGGLSSVSRVPGFDFPSGYTAFQFVFVFVQSSAFGGVFTGFGIATDFENGFSRRLMLAAPNRLAILAGYTFGALVRALITGALLFVVALIGGMQVDGGALGVLGLVGLAIIA